MAMRMGLLFGDVKVNTLEVQVVHVRKPNPRRGTLRRNALLGRFVPLGLLEKLVRIFHMRHREGLVEI